MIKTIVIDVKMMKSKNIEFKLKELMIPNTTWKIPIQKFKPPFIKVKLTNIFNYAT